MNEAIRPATPDDEPLIREALYHAVYVPPGLPPMPRSIVDDPGVRRYIRDWGRVGDSGVIAEIGDQRDFAGAAWLRLWSGEDRGYGYIDEATPELSIALLPLYRNRGLGSRMLGQLLAAAAESYDAVSLSVSIGNPAQRLYERFGFKGIKVQDDSILMRRPCP